MAGRRSMALRSVVYCSAVQMREALRGTALAVADEQGEKLQELINRNKSMVLLLPSPDLKYSFFWRSCS